MGGGESKHRSSYRYPNDPGYTSGYSARYSTTTSYVQPEATNRVQKRYSRINDDYQTLSQVYFSQNRIC